MRPQKASKSLRSADKKEMTAKSQPKSSAPASGCRSHLRAAEVRGVVETHGGAEVLDAVPRGSREDALRPRDVIQAWVEDLQVKVGPRARDEMPLEFLQWEHELRQLLVWQP